MKTNEHIAKVIGRDLPISTKQSIEISNRLRGRTLQSSQALLKRVIAKSEAIPFTRFNRDMGHRPGKMAAGRYPEKAAKAFANLLNSVESNAQNKGLDTENLVIKTIISNKASQPFKFGRRRRIRAKRTHIEIVVEELERKVVKKAQPKTEPKQEKKPEAKAQPKQEVKKETPEKKEQKK